MRPIDLLLVVATPVVCAVQLHTVVHVPVLLSNQDVASNSYYQGLPINGTTGKIFHRSVSTLYMVTDSLVPNSYCQELNRSISRLYKYSFYGSNCGRRNTCTISRQVDFQLDRIWDCWAMSYLNNLTTEAGYGG